MLKLELLRKRKPKQFVAGTAKDGTIVQFERPVGIYGAILRVGEEPTSS